MGVLIYREDEVLFEHKDAEPILMDSEELTALADWHAKEQWVWDRVAQHTEKPIDREIADHHRDKVRRYRELAAYAEQDQTEYEQEERSNDSS